MKIKGLIMGGLLSLAMAVTFIPNAAFAVPQEGGDVQETVTVQTEEETVTPNVDLAEPDQLLQDYLQKHAEQKLAAKNKKAAKRKAPRKTGLSETDAYVYDVLKDEIALIANGERESTVISVPMVEIFGEMEPLTKEDLGVPIFVDEAINPEAMEAMQELSPVDFSRIVDALLTDLPYDLYWFDKTTGYSYGYPGFSISYSEDEYELCFAGEEGDEDNPCITLAFAVSSDYIPEEESDGYTVDTAKTGAASTAATVAAEVVSDYEGESDLNKLIGYKDTICEYTDYNHPAADDNSTPYGNPWQLIWVFDDDPSTTVVCEGYSKAFQLLCDLSSFENSDIESHIVSGDMDGGTGAGAHMWNVMQMDDGANYIVDVTNCDTDSIGYKEGGITDWLFLKGYARLESDEHGDKYVYLCQEEPDPEDPDPEELAEVSYKYDDETLALYDADELELSDSDYHELSEEEKNQKAADHVADLINGTLDLGGIDEDNVEEAEAPINAASQAFKALTDEQKALVDPALVEQLRKMQAELEAIKAQTQAVDHVIGLIDALPEIKSPEDITEEISEQIAEARAAYDALTEEQKEKVTNYDTLENAELQQSLAGSTEIELDVSQKVNIKTGGDEAIFTFTPDHDGTNVFSSSGAKDTKAEAFDASGERIAVDDDGGEGSNFMLILSDAKAGETYFLHCYFYSDDMTGSFSVLLIESTVSEITYTFAENHTLIENVDGDWETVEEDNKYFYYNMPGYQENDILTLTDKDGNSEAYTYTIDGEDEWTFVSGSGEKIAPSMVQFSSEQDEQHWGVGDTNEVLVSYMGISTVALITIEPNPVTGITFLRDGKAEVNLVENRDGKQDEDYNDETDEYETYFKYDLPFREGDQLTLEGSGGPCGTYIWVDSKGGFYLKGHPVIDEYDIAIASDQSVESPWTKDDEEDHQMTLSYYGQSCDVSVRIVGNPITEIEYAGDPIVLTKEVGGNWVGDEEDPDRYYEYDINAYNLKGNAKFILRGDEALAGTYVYDEEEEAFICEDTGKKIEPWDIEPVEGVQSKSPWTVGTDNKSVWTYEGIQFTIPVTIEENDIESIEFTPADEPYYLFEQENQETFVGGAKDELRNTTGHELTLTKTDGTSLTYTFQEVEDEDLEESRYFVSENGEDLIDFYDLEFSTDDNEWSAGDEANLTVTYKGRETAFSMQVRAPIVRIEYIPAKDYVVYEGVGEEDEDGFWYELKTEQPGDQLKLYDSNDENAEPAFTFICQKERADGAEWEDADGLGIRRLGDFYIASHLPWTGQGPWTMEAIFRANSSDYDNEYYVHTAEIPVELSDENPVKSVSYEQNASKPVTMYQGIHDGIGESGYSGYTAITEGDTVTITFTQGGTKTYKAVFDEDLEEIVFQNEEDEEDVLDWTYLTIKADGDEEWTPGEHTFTFTYYGVESDKKLQVTIEESPVTNVTFTPAQKIEWEADTTGHDVENDDGEIITVYERYYGDAGYAVFHEGDKLKFTWMGSEEKEYTYGTNSEGDEDFFDADGKEIDVPVHYEDDQLKGDPWKIGVNKGYICVGGVRSEAFDITINCEHRLLTHTAKVDASCTDAGQEEYWTCVLCGTMFADQSHEHEIDAPVAIEPAHEWDQWEKLNEESHQRTCDVCGVSEQAAHTWGQWTVVTEATEENPGERTCECEVCGYVKTEVIPVITHVHALQPTEAKSATCEEDGNSAYWTCTECGKFFSDEDGKNEISENSWVVKGGHKLKATEAKSATCEEDGNSAYWTCSECGKFFSDKDGKNEITENSWIIKGGHKLTETAAKAATCEEDGNTAYWTCSDCGTFFSDEGGKNEITETSWIVKGGHKLTATEAKSAT
ncbi:MAG: hypothetical protein IJ128_03660, partial [Firmicutes bacterium]|nr:hypothetical protein [Bacillota bacterium]